ncbi:MAG: TonB-dependent receptor [Rhodoferax sp.]|nr:TonB-dependent receptor [Rhodoferax sp.]
MRCELSPVVLALAGVVSLAHGQDAPTLPTVSVTAKGYVSDDLIIPGATIVVDRDELLRRGANNPGEALRGKPGLAVASDGPQGQNPVIRGLKKESVVLLVDGMRLNSAQPQGAIASFMSLGLAQRVEVIKGPASVLYGTGALGGVINVLLPQARFKDGIGFEANAGYDSASSGLRSTGVMNVAQGDHALMLGASVAHIGDYQAPAGEIAKTGYDSDSLIGQYRYRIDSAQQLRMSLQQHTDEDVWYPGSKKPHASTLVGNTTVHSPEQTRQLIEVGYNRKGMSDQKLNIDLRAYRQQVDRNIYTYAQKMGRDIGQADASFVTDGIDARADWLALPQHLLSFGVNAWHMAADTPRLLPTPASNPINPLARSDPFNGGKLDALGFYLQDDAYFGKLNVLTGLRHDTVKGSAAWMGNQTVNTGLDRSDSAVSGSLGLIYEVDPLIRPFANLSRGFRTGEMRERFEASSRGDGFFYVGNPQIKPEIANQFELGFKGSSDALSYTLSAYRNRISNYIAGQQVFGATAIAACGTANAAYCKKTINLGQVVIQGLEASAKWQFQRNQWLNVGYSRLRGENKDLNEPLFQMPADELSFGWEGNVAAGWTADATLRLVDRQDRLAKVFARGTENATPGFGTFNLGVTWGYAKNQSLRVALKNLADKAYHEHLTEGVSGQEIEASGRSLQIAWNGSF